MTLNELIEQSTNLRESNPDLGGCPVHFQYNYGDHWRTQVAPEVSEVEEGSVVWSDYHSMPKVYDHEGECDRKDQEEITKVIILNSR